MKLLRHRFTLAAYGFLTWALQHWVKRRLRRRAVSEPLYGEWIHERFGHYNSPTSHGWVWIHAVSLGETRAAAILITELRQCIPNMRLLLTHGTATGRQEGQKLLQKGDQQVWQPWDTKDATERFLKHHRPRIGILMETEVWPQLCARSQAAQIP
jgi:3-deoxy-D-manno-octulosonic-acid transferase